MQTTFPGVPVLRSWLARQADRPQPSFGGDAVGTGVVDIIDLEGRDTGVPRRQPYGAMTFLVDRGPVTATAPDESAPLQESAEERAVNALVPNYRFSSPLREYIWVQKERRSVERRWNDALARLRERGDVAERVADRVASMLQEEREEQPGVEHPIALDSLLTLECFIREFNVTRAPALSVTPRGNLRASWRDDQSRVVGLEFLPRNAVAYVILDVVGEGEREPAYGSAGWPKMRRMLGALDAARILCA